MYDLTDSPCWFLGVNSPKGYCSKFDQLFLKSPEGKCFLLKGGPGTGKSTILKKVAEALAEKGRDIELVFCSADTGSLDAVIIPDGKFVVADATLPHSAEPKYPGIYETTVDLSDCWDKNILCSNSEEIAELFDLNRRLHEEARGYLSAAANLIEEAAKAGMESLFWGNVEKAALRICHSEIGKGNKKRGTEKQRFLSAITEKGTVFMNKTPGIICEKIYAFEDETGAASRVFMNTVRKYAIENGLDIITCKCPLFPLEKTEHVFIPSQKIGFITVNKRHKTDIPFKRTLHSARFYDREKYSKQKPKIRFSLRIAEKLIEEASLRMKEAKTVHDKLENFYIKAMDFSKADEKLRKIIEEI